MRQLQRRQLHRTIAMLVTAATVLAVTVVSLPHRPPAASAAGGDGPPRPPAVIVHLFQWPWNSIAQECTAFLGPRGYGAIQVSPPQEHVVLPARQYPWWQDYQPVSYRLVSRRGDRAAFAGMVSTCNAAGVAVYVDAVVNHMAGGASTGQGSAGSTYGHYDYPGIYGFDDFHHCGRHGDDDLRAWTDRWEVQNCELLDLADLETESAYVRDRLVAYLNDLLSLGVDGFRVDAAKHLPAADLQAIRGRLSGPAYVYQEVIEGGPGEISPSEYTGIGDVTEFRYGDTVGNAFRDRNLANLNQLGSSMLLSSQDAVVFIDNHDTQRNGRARLTYKDGAAYHLAEAFMLAWPHGTPAVMSSFAFGDPEQGPPAGAGGITGAATCSDPRWVCEHRVQAIAGMVGFHNAVAGTAVTDWWTGGGGQIAFGRGAAGYAVFNRGATLTRTFQTSLPAGTYCDVARGELAGGSCTGPAHTVDGAGRFTATVPADAALALHAGARLPGTPTTTGPTTTTTCPSVSAAFAVNATTFWGQNVFLVGDLPQLGNWSPASAVPLSATTYPVWRATVSLPKSTPFQYKYIKKNPDGAIIWESDPNRSRTTPSGCSVTYDETWR